MGDAVGAVCDPSSLDGVLCMAQAVAVGVDLPLFRGGNELMAPIGMLVLVWAVSAVAGSSALPLT